MTALDSKVTETKIVNPGVTRNNFESDINTESELPDDEEMEIPQKTLKHSHER